MDQQFPSNSIRPQPPTQQREEKKVERIVTGEVIRRKTPMGRRFLNGFLSGDGLAGARDYVVGDVVLPGVRFLVFDAFVGYMERAFFYESPGHRPRRHGGMTNNRHVSYDRYSGPGNPQRHQPDPRGSNWRRDSRAIDDIVLDNRGAAEEVLDRLIDLAQRYDAVSVSDLYQMIGQSIHPTDYKFGWAAPSLSGSFVSRVKGGYLLNLPRPEPID